jgi:hypothetical protein
MGINSINITLSHPATLASGDVDVSSAAGVNYGPVTVSGSGTGYTITLTQPINAADRVSFTIGNAGIATFTRRLDVLPGDVNDDGIVTLQDAVQIHNYYTGIGTVTVAVVFLDINGDGVVGINDYNLTRSLIGTQLGPAIFSGSSLTFPVSQGETYRGAVAIFTDVFSDTLTRDLAATIDWGDGSAPTTGTILGSSGSFSVAGNHTYAAAGASFPVSVTVEDSEGDSVTIASTAQSSGSAVSASGVSLTAPTGLPLSATVAAFTLALPDPSETFTATIAWGDGMNSQGAVTASTSEPGTYSVSGQHTYASSSPASVIVTVSGSEGAAITADSTITFTTGNSGAGSSNGGVTNYLAYAIVPAVGVEFHDVVATFQDPGISDPNGLTATINWGDGTRSTGLVTGTSPGNFSVSGGHTFTEDPEVSVNVMGPNGGFTTSQTVEVGTSAPVISTAPLTEAFQKPWVSSVTFQGEVADFTGSGPNAVPGDYTATIDWGDGSGTEPATISGDARAGFVIQAASHVFSEDGSFDVTITLVGPGQVQSVAHAMVEVIEPPLNFAVSNFNGIDIMGYLSSTGDLSTNEADVQIDWGDGETSTAQLSPYSSSSLKVFGEHSYYIGGFYRVTLTATNDQGETSTDQVFADVTSAQAPTLTATRGLAYLQSAIPDPGNIAISSSFPEIGMSAIVCTDVNV